MCHLLVFEARELRGLAARPPPLFSLLNGVHALFDRYCLFAPVSLRLTVHLRHLDWSARASKETLPGLKTSELTTFFNFFREEAVPVLRGASVPFSFFNIWLTNERIVN